MNEDGQINSKVRNSAGEQVLATTLAQAHLEIAHLVNELEQMGENQRHLSAAYREVREVLTASQRKKLGIDES